MIEQDAVQQLKEKTLQEYQRAGGIWDLALGLAIILFGVSVNLNFSYMYGIFALVIVNMFRDLQKRFIYPRLGRAEFYEKGKKQGLIFWGILYSMFFLCAVGLTDYWNGIITFYLSILWVLLIILGGFLRRIIFFIYGCAVFVPLLLASLITNSIALIVITVASVVLTYIVLKLFVHDRTMLEPAKTRAGITAHLFVAFAALGLAGYLILKHFNPEQTASLIAKLTVYKYFYLGLATSVVVFVIGFALKLKSFYWYAVILAMLSIVWRLQLLPRPYFIAVFMLFGVIVMGYRLIHLQKFIRDNPVLEKE